MANYLVKILAPPTAISRAAADTAKRIIFNMLSPGEWLLVIQSESGFVLERDIDRCKRAPTG